MNYERSVLLVAKSQSILPLWVRKLPKFYSIAYSMTMRGAGLFAVPEATAIQMLRAMSM